MTCHPEAKPKDLLLKHSEIATHLRAHPSRSLIARRVGEHEPLASLTPQTPLHMHYRLYNPADFPKLYAIEEACFQPPDRFGRGYMRSLISHPPSATWIAEDAGVMAGFAIVHWSGDPPARTAYIQTLEVDLPWRRRGIARQLLRLLEGSALQARASLIWLHVDAANTPAIETYRAAGYVHQGVEDDYYGPGRPADVYARPLVPQQPESHAPESDA